MKKSLLLFFFLLFLINAKAQFCNEYLVSYVNDTTNFRPLSYSLTYNSFGLPKSRINYEPGTQNVKFIQNYYYTGNRLDSLMGYVNGNRVGKLFAYDAFGNLISIYDLNDFPSGNSVSYFGYNNNKLSTIYIQDLGFNCSNISYDGTSLQSGSLHFSPYGGSPFEETFDFVYDTVPNPLFQKTGIVDNPLLYLTPKPFLGFKNNNSSFKPIISYNIKYDSVSKMISGIRYSSAFTDVINTQRLGFQYTCSSFVTGESSQSLSEPVLAVSPNPSSDGLFTLNFNSAKSKLFTARGELMFETTKPLIDLSTQPSGIYILHVASPDGTKVFKLIKN